MNEEFAIEPSAFTDFKDVRYVLGKFGFHEGRFISAIPGKWVSEVYAHLEKLPVEKLPDVAKHRAKELVRITKARGGVVSGGANFDPTKPWVANAVAYKEKFAGILVSAETTGRYRGEDYKSVDAIDDSFFGSCRAIKLAATVAEFGRIAARLLEISHEVFLIDPYFDFSKSSCVNVLKEFIRIGTIGRCKQFVIFTAAKVNNYDGVEQILREIFPGKNVSIRVQHVEQDVSASAFHARYLLSKFGGISFDKGFRTENVFHDVAAIDVGMHDALCKMYLDGEHGFKILATNDLHG